MVSRLKDFKHKHGHTLVSKYDDRELHRWAQSIRKNYVHPTRNSNNNNNISSKTGFHHAAKQKNEETSTTTATTTTQQRWAETDFRQLEAASYPRPLSKQRLDQLEEVNFTWDVQEALWNRKWQELQEFVEKEGHCCVPARHATLGVWVRNQRREFRNLERGETSTLTKERLEKLHSVAFPFPKPRLESWEARYQELVQYYQKHGHADVPEKWVENFPLGQWCRNQRTAYLCLQQGLPSGLTEEKIQLLQDLGFSWNLREKRWQEKLDRLRSYYQTHGNVEIPPEDAENRDLRIWLTFQRYYYHRRKRLSQKQPDSSSVSLPISCPLTEERISAMERLVPNFPWKLRDSSGPSRKDWADLFQAMRDKGIRPGMRPKQHWFEGEDRFSVTVKDVWTEEDLLELWNQEGDDDDQD